MTGDRLRELARAAEANAEFYTPSGVLAQQELETLAPDMAVQLADAIDALDYVVRRKIALDAFGLGHVSDQAEPLLARFRQLGDTA